MPFSLNTLPWRERHSNVTANENEELVDSFSTHWIKYLVPLLLFALIGGLCILGFETAQAVKNTSQTLGMSMFLLSFIAMTAIHHWFFHRILSEGMIDVVITTRRFIYLEANLWLSDDMHEISLDEIRAVQAYKKGIFQNLLRYGSLWFDTGGTDREKGRIIRLVPHPQAKAKTIMTALNLK